MLSLPLVGRWAEMLGDAGDAKNGGGGTVTGEGVGMFDLTAQRGEGGIQGGVQLIGGLAVEIFAAAGEFFPEGGVVAFPAVKSAGADVEFAGNGEVGVTGEQEGDGGGLTGFEGGRNVGFRELRGVGFRTFSDIF